MAEELADSTAHRGSSATTDSVRWLWAAIAVVSLVLQAVGAGDALRFDRVLVDDGAIWRLLTGHMVHLNWAHWALNMVGLALVAFFLGSHGGLRGWLGAIFFSALFTGLGVYSFNPDTMWLVGLSAVLHGLFVYGAVLETAHDRAGGIVLMALVVGKLVWEQLSGPMPGSEAVVGGRVLTDAHLYGAIGGASALLVFSPRMLLRIVRRPSES